MSESLVIPLAAVMVTALALVVVLALRVCNLAETLCDLCREVLREPGEPEEACLICELEGEEHDAG
ncbi:MAG TPA: hypothetical protein VNA32_07350 [Actinomycetota bacterium]|nr:hypothetical protein [Actinomycetota bacterium]